MIIISTIFLFLLFFCRIQKFSGNIKNEILFFYVDLFFLFVYLYRLIMLVSLWLVLVKQHPWKNMIYKWISMCGMKLICSTYSTLYLTYFCTTYTYLKGRHFCENMYIFFEFNFAILIIKCTKFNFTKHNIMAEIKFCFEKLSQNNFFC